MPLRRRGFHLAVTGLYALCIYALYILGGRVTTGSLIFPGRRRELSGSRVVVLKHVQQRIAISVGQEGRTSHLATSAPRQTARARRCWSSPTDVAVTRVLVMTAQREASAVTTIAAHSNTGQGPKAIKAGTRTLYRRNDLDVPGSQVEPSRV
jgi:hypothetical protein